jgi:hypothetical protein
MEQLEATYQTNLRALHAPILQEYVHQLEQLKNQLIARNRLTDAQQVDAELARIKTIATTTGVLPLVDPEPAGEPSADDAASKAATPPPSPAAKPDRRNLPTLLAAEALKSSEVNATTGAIPLGTAEWRVPRLAPGTYDVLMVYSTADLPLPEQIKLHLDGREISAAIPSDRATGSPETFRLLRLCQVKVDTEIKGGTLNISAASGDQARVWMKKIIFSVPKPPASPSPN